MGSELQARHGHAGEPGPCRECRRVNRLLARGRNRVARRCGRHLHRRPYHAPGHQAHEHAIARSRSRSQLRGDATVTGPLGAAPCNSECPERDRVTHLPMPPVPPLGSLRPSGGHSIAGENVASHSRRLKMSQWVGRPPPHTAGTGGPGDGGHGLLLCWSVWRGPHAPARATRSSERCQQVKRFNLDAATPPIDHYAHSDNF